MLSQLIHWSVVFNLVILSVNSLEIKTSSGTIKGKSIEVLNKTINQFLNIPYAEPPVGKLRFSKPLPIKEPIKNIIDGTKTGNSCFQNDPKISQLLKTSEDCLVLNIWSPQINNSGELKPVMFWIHGGGYQTGSIFLSDIYNGKNLATFDVVVVTINYRLGPFGWLYGDDDSAPGNVGLYDQVLALKWVKQNIHLFGGDSTQITIFGESAGSWSVSAHIISPLSAGLFKRAILQSGAVFNNKEVPELTKTKALSEAKQLAQHFNCSDTQWLECLRNVDPKQVNSLSHLKTYVIHGTEIIPISAQKAFQTNNYSSDIDIMSGVMKNEGSYLTHKNYPKSEQLKSSEEFIEMIKSLPFPELNVQKITEFYLKGVDTNSTEALKLAFYDFYGDLHMKCPTYLFTKQFAEHSKERNVFFYEWTYPSHLMAPLLGCVKDMGVCHTSDLEYVFGLSVSMNTSDKEFSKDVMKMWTNFAKNGKPVEGWPRLVSPSNNVIKIKEINPLFKNHIFENLFNDICDKFWKNYFI